jgi:hypothetical protein
VNNPCWSIIISWLPIGNNNQSISLQYTILHSISTWYPSMIFVFHYIIYFIVQYITLYCIMLHYVFIMLHYVTLYCIMLHYVTLYYIILHYITLHYYMMLVWSLPYITILLLSLSYSISPNDCPIGILDPSWELFRWPPNNKGLFFWRIFTHRLWGLASGKHLQFANWNIPTLS